jgi:hypothetical protein
MAPIKFSVKQLLAQSFLPGGGDAGRGKAPAHTFYVCKDSGAVFVSDAEGALLCISDLLLGKAAVRAFPTHGCAGKDGADSTVPGARGPAGADGRNGIDGRPGRDAVGSVGPQGVPGKNGVDSIASPERVQNLETAVRDLRAERATWVSEIAALKAELKALVDMDANKGVYMEWLRTKAQARAEKKGE